MEAESFEETKDRDEFNRVETTNDQSCAVDTPDFSISGFFFEVLDFSIFFNLYLADARYEANSITYW